VVRISIGFVRLDPVPGEQKDFKKMFCSAGPGDKSIAILDVKI
jgi:hypothetical protein